MTPEEIMVQFTAIALKELLRNDGDNLVVNGDYKQEHIGKAAANVAKSAFKQMQTNLGELHE